MLTAAIITERVREALREDAPWGDLTAQVAIREDARLSAVLNAREPGVFAGGDVFAAAFRELDPSVTVTLLARDGDRFAAGDVLARVEGPARSVLTAERIALNFTQRMSGIATLTAQFVAETAGTTARIADTRKTTPGLRAFEKHAVRAGGGFNHRFGLSDAVMVKDNHLAALGATSAQEVTEALIEIRSSVGHTTTVEVEVDRIDQVEPVLAAGIPVIMLDNFTESELRAGVALIAGRAVVEASGGVSLGTVAAIARTGVDVISVGQLTHGARALDLGLDAVADSGVAAEPENARETQRG